MCALFDLSFITGALKDDLGMDAQDVGRGVIAQKLKELCEREACTHAEMQLLLRMKTRDASPADMTVVSMHWNEQDNLFSPHSGSRSNWGVRHSRISWESLLSDSKHALYLFG
jgi:hypothetical protein